MGLFGHRSVPKLLISVRLGRRLRSVDKEVHEEILRLWKGYVKNLKGININSLFRELEMLDEQIKILESLCKKANTNAEFERLLAVSRSTTLNIFRIQIFIKDLAMKHHDNAVRKLAVEIMSHLISLQQAITKAHEQSYYEQE